MDINEQLRLNKLNNINQIGNQIFDEIKKYYKVEPLLKDWRIIDLNNHRLFIDYAYKTYILEIVESNHFQASGQIIVKTPKQGAEHIDSVNIEHPHWEVKSNSTIHFDKTGNLFFNITPEGYLAAYPNNNDYVERLIAEIVK